VRRARSFVSASLHRGTDGTKVTMYAQWQNIDHYQAMRQDPGPLPFLQEALKIAKFNPPTRSCEPSPPPVSRIETRRLRPLCAAVHPGSLFLRSDNKRRKATRALHRMAFARLSP
jgi:hypothetical protein